ncbi:hypothetical protein LTR84_000418 [Exophiala bonariae]|uniref:2-dehydropantoate 2-reductase n=1 Tax=Exophiala bonariae TaxID=1690606 RepID=A0AAV9NR11_9EURO|nr:hypothetical protein LTR84_000418 [Exophiala bonariae]
MVNILIFGTGSVGTVYAMILLNAGANLTCLCRSNLEAAKSHGFTIKSSIFGEQKIFPTVVGSIQEVADANSSSPFDFVVVSTKATSQSAVAAVTSLRPLVKAHFTTIVLIQNGIGIENSFHDAFPDNSIISGVTYLPTSRIGQTVYSHTETQILHLGPFPAGRASAAERQHTDDFAALIRAGGGHALVHTDVQVERWKKLIGNTTWNPICALSRCRDLEFLQSSVLAPDFVRRVMLEVVAVANAIGYGEHIQLSAVESQMQRSAARSWPGVEPSMMSDMSHTRTMEVEAIVGQVVQVAKGNGIDVPRLETLYVLLSGLDWALKSKKQ